MSRIFINYRRQDSEGYVGRLYDTLAQHFARTDIFMDVDNIKPGADFITVLEEAVAGCDVFLAVIGPIWSTISDDQGKRRLENWNDFVRIELASALKQGKLVIPVLVGRAQMPSPTDLPDDLVPLVRRNAIEISHQRFTYDVERLANVIKEVFGDRTAATTPVVTSASNPQKEALFKAARADLVDATTSPLYAVRSQNRYFPVIGEGNLDAKIMLIGAAPGKHEAEQGRPFIGPSGDVLEEMLNIIQLKRADVFITNLVLDYPGEKRDPTVAEIAFYGPFLDRLIDIVQPRIIATLGGFAMDYILKKLDLPEKREKISQIHGKLIKTRVSYGEIHVVPLYHPAVVLYSMTQKEPLKKDFAKLKLFI
jgi:uracil-DNA glycosylase family 4